MKTRTNPKSWCIQEIKNPVNKHEEIGQLMLVSYMRGKSLPYLEFFIKDEFETLRGTGIMSRELPKYLKYLQKWGHNQLLATVKRGNTPSIKLLEKNDFIRATEFNDNICYMIDLEFTKEKLLLMQKLSSQAFNRKKYG